jgi:hypothetical protein
LPVPGGPVSNAPLGILAPSLLYLSAFFKKSMNSTIYYLALFIPTTSLNLTEIVCLNLWLLEF